MSKVLKFVCAEVPFDEMYVSVLEGPMVRPGLKGHLKFYWTVGEEDYSIILSAENEEKLLQLLKKRKKDGSGPFSVFNELLNGGFN